MLDRRTLEQIQADTGFNLDILEKVYHMSRTLSGLTQIKGFLDNFALKGGTSLNFLFLNVPRLSIDLDFDFIGDIEKNKMQLKRKAFETKIDSLGDKLEYDGSSRNSSYIIGRRQFRFRKLSGITDFVKIELNYIDRMPIDGTYSKRFPDIIPEHSGFFVNTYSLEELCAQKIAACLERGTARDVFDIYEYSKMDMDLKKLKRLSALYFLLSSRTQDPDLTKVQGFESRRLQSELRLFLRDSTVLETEDIKNTALRFLRDILEFEGPIREFIEQFYKHNRIESKLILPDGPDVNDHPGIKFVLDKRKSE